MIQFRKRGGHADIIIQGLDAMIKGDYPVSIVIDNTSYYQQGYQFTQKYKMGRWDGRVKLFSRSMGVLPAGLVPDVAEALREVDTKVNIDDRRHCPAIPPITKDITLHGVSFDYPYDFQLDCMEVAIKKHRGIIHIATSGGKCLGKGTPVIKYDGTIVRVEDVCVGDRLMGPDSLPRHVLSTNIGYGKLFLIEPRKGSHWVCNEDHILTLIHTVTGKIIDISVRDYLNTHKTFKHCHKLFSTGVNFEKKVDLPIDPYFLGLWFGDGSKNKKGVVISNPDIEIHEYLKEFAKIWRLKFKCFKYLEKCPTLRLVRREGESNTLLTKLRKVVGEKNNIPREYLMSSREDRLKFLAGFLDTDGYLHHGFFEITQKRDDYANAICFLARSLGYRATKKKKFIKGYGIYHKINIIGDLTNIPVRVKRKIPKPRKKKRDTTRTGFKVSPIGNGNYYGFTLCGDGRFLLGDFTVTHNTVVYCLLARCLRLPTLVLVPGIELLYQTANKFASCLGLKEENIGVIGDGHWKPNSWITIASVASMYRRLTEQKCKDFLKKINLLIADEAHKTSSDSYYAVMRNCPAFFRFGGSGTPLKRTDGADLKLIAATGPIIYSVRNKDLIERGVSNKVEIHLVRIEKPVLDKKTPYQTVYKEGITNNIYRNRMLCQLAFYYTEQKRQVLMLVKEIAHGKALDERLWTFKTQSFVTHQFINGKEPSDVRNKALDDFRKGELRVLISSVILDEGVDLPSIDVLILAGSGRSTIKTLQRIGRGLRKGGSTDTLIVIDTVDFQHRYLLEHSYQRLQDYKAEECFGIKEINIRDFV